MPATEQPEFVQPPAEHPQRHGIYMPPRGTFVEAGRTRDISRMPNPDIRFGICLWPSEVRAYLPPAAVDDTFTDAAVRLRQLGPKLVIALEQMQEPLEDLKNRTVGAIPDELTVELAERTPLAIDAVSRYLGEILDHAAAVIPACYGERGLRLEKRRGSLRRLASAPLGGFDPRLAELLAPGGQLPDWAETVALSSIGAPSDFSNLPLANDPNLYLITNHPNFTRAPEEQRLEALKASARQTIAAAEAIDRAMLGLCRWLDALVEHLITVVCEEAAEGQALRARWERAEWTIVSRLSFSDPDAALAVTRALPAIHDGPLLPGTENL